MIQIRKIARRKENRTRLKQTAVLSLVILLLIGSVPFGVSAQDGTNTTKCDFGPPAGTEETEDIPIEVVLVNDRSGSMDETVENNKTRLDFLKESTKNFVDQKEESEEISHVSYDDESILEQELTTEKEPVKESIDALEADGSTEMGSGIDEATTELTDGENASENAEKIIIVNTDGEDGDEQAALDAAENARDENITIYSIGISDNIGESEEDFLIDIAGEEGRYFANPDETELQSIYDDIRQAITTKGSKDLQINTRSLFEPGATHEYEVIYNNTTTGERSDVTDEIDISSTDSDLLSVDNEDNTLTATSNEDTSNWVRLDGSYDGVSGCTNVVISSPDVDNLEILPFMWRIGTLISDRTFQTVLVGLFLAIAATRVGGVFAGLGIYQMILTAGWLIGWVPIGLAMVGLFSTLFIGLNIAANIDYTVRR